MSSNCIVIFTHITIIFFMLLFNLQLYHSLLKISYKYKNKLCNIHALTTNTNINTNIDINIESYDNLLADRLESLKIDQLRKIMRRYGTKPGELRKAELIVKCKELLSTALEKSLNNNDKINKLDIKINNENNYNNNESLNKINNDSDVNKLDYNTSSNNNDNSKPLIEDKKYMKILQQNTLNRPTSTIKSFKSEKSSIYSNNYSNTSYTTKNNNNSNNTTRFPTGNRRMDRFINDTKTDMEVTFLGTASCIPSITRGVSSTLLRLDGDMFIFDCGEGTQLQIQKISSKLSTISKIFITHTHGDHLFGLPGLLCFLGQAIQMSQTTQVIDIYGPMGIRDYIRASMSMTYSRIAVQHRIHELADVPYLHGRQEDTSFGGQTTVKTRYDPTYGEIDKGSTIYPNEDGTYTLFEDFKSIMKAAPLRHTIPCVGYVYTEKPKVGQLKVNEIKEIVDRNKDSLTLKYKDVYTVFRDLKALGQEDSYTFPDGTIVKGCDIVEKPIRGRKVVILGDTCNSDMIAPIAMNADLLIHEATNAYFEDSKFSNYNYLERDTRNHGHSTPQMAGNFANKINAKRLVLTHFSNRYLGDESDYSMKVMWKIEDMARETCPSLSDPNSIVAAWDMLLLPVQSSKTKIKKRNNINSEGVLVDLKQYSQSKILNRNNVYISQYNENDFEDVNNDEQNN